MGVTSGISESGLSLFLKYAEGCRMYLEGKGLISDSDRKALDSGQPSYDVLKRVFYVAVPVLERIAEQKGKGKDVFDLEVLREFYSGEHNERKFREGELACLAFPVRVIEKRDHGSERAYLVEMEPVNGIFEVESGLELEPGDWAVMHRISLVERVPEDFALGMAEKLRSLGMDKTYKFPKAAIKYLKALRRGKDNQKQNRRNHGNNKEQQGAQDAGNDKAPHDEGRPEEASDQRAGEAYA